MTAYRVALAGLAFGALALAAATLLQDGGWATAALWVLWPAWAVSAAVAGWAGVAGRTD
ncbi:hypothetical protein [Streptomyces uncialis]|uniref:hypothetical protein n=1 Tax=Streptomyces uncialis TaxID=1048205 RepID=UPI0037A318EB